MADTKVRFVYSNQSEAGSPTSTDAATGFPATAAIDLDRTSYWKAATAYTNGYLRVDLGSSKTITGLGLANHNIGTLTGTQKLQYSTNDSTWSDAATIAPAATGDYYARINTGTGYTARYWRLLLNSSGAERAYVGEFYLGTCATVTNNPDIGFVVEDVWQDLSSASIAGHQVVKETGRLTTLHRARWNPTTEAQMTEIRTVLVAQSGRLKPFFYAPRSDSSTLAEGPAYYVRLADARWTREEIFTGVWGFDLTLEEQQ